MKSKHLLPALALILLSLVSIEIPYARAHRPLPPAGNGSATGSTVTGRVKFEGTAPKPVTINMAADPTCVKEHPGKMTSQDIVEGNDGSVENVVVFVSSGLQNRSFDVPQEPVTIEQKGCMYTPHVIALRANQKIDVVNQDKTAHNIHPTPTNNREWNKFQPPGSPLEETFARQEIAIPVRCNVHPWMRGYIAVFNNPFFAVTGKDGAFNLSGLPPGEYTIQAWHEKLGTLTQKVTIAAGESRNLDFIFKN